MRSRLALALQRHTICLQLKLPCRYMKDTHQVPPRILNEASSRRKFIIRLERIRRVVSNGRAEGNNADVRLLNIHCVRYIISRCDSVLFPISDLASPQAVVWILAPDMGWTVENMVLVLLCDSTCASPSSSSLIFHSQLKCW
jgi:hypothetical protein